jgi:predicted Zn-dependent protease
MKEYFYKLADFAGNQTRSGEITFLNFRGENSQFCRFNKNRVRQAGDVQDRRLSLTLACDQKQSTVAFDITLNELEDRKAVSEGITSLRDLIGSLPPDPHFLYSQSVHSSESIARKQVPDSRELAPQIMDACDGLDMVGFLANGGLFRGFANSLGQRNWYERYTAAFDWSAYKFADKAVKSVYAGTTWDGTELKNQVAQVRNHLEYMARPAATLKPGSYRIYLAPPALEEMLGMLAYGGFSEKAHRTKGSSLLKLADGTRAFHESFSFIEDREAGLGPSFDSWGFVLPSKVDLIKNGKHAGNLISPRSAKEFGLVPNADGESPGSWNVAPGTIPQAEVLKELGTGIYINNLWYLNYSDRMSCKVTGMTRFASFWVENGEIVAPINVMRFDDSAFDLLGTRLVGLTKERSFLMDTSTYAGRSAASANLPGAIISECAFTL